MFKALAVCLLLFTVSVHCQGFVRGCGSGVSLSTPAFNKLLKSLKAIHYPSPRETYLESYLKDLHVGFTGAQTAQIMAVWTVDDSTKLAVFNIMSRWILGLTAKDIVTILDTAQFDESKLTLLSGVVHLIYEPELKEHAQTIINAFQYPEDQNKAKTMLKGVRPVSCLFGDVSSIKRPYFIIDVSRSMSNKFELANGTYSTRLAYVQQELVKTLEELTPSQEFNIVAFSIRLYEWKPKLVSATTTNVNSAIDWVDALDVHSATDMYKAFKFAFADTNCDGIFLLTDGQPTDASGSTIVKAAAKWSASHNNAPITAILFEAGDSPYPNDPGAKPFMKSLAAAANGVYKDLEK
eukprot:TRINITY_DN74834_c0_g1_i1.p1 TRINITY_DN74834_c0_g1~~TRINITY_DN74834_c0_g1_i1.p1  ORF type:complete len:351 (-),score=55.80 TRINITY_DN74834_c0_g1_i1:111-1163(-)